MTKNKLPHILFHRPTSWDSEINCSTKIYAKLFSEAGYRVTYLQGNINLVHLILKKGYYHTWKKGSRFEGRIWVTSGCSIVPYLDRNSLLAKFTGRLSYHTLIPRLKKLVGKSGYGEPDIIWTTIPGTSVLKKIFPHSKLVFHVIDNYSAYRGEGVKVLEKADYSHSDHVFVIGNAIENYLIREFDVNRHKITNLGQGVFLNNYNGQYRVPDEIRKLPTPIAIWVGLIKKIDFELLLAAYEFISNKGGCLLLIGPGKEYIPDNIIKLPKLKYIGAQHSSEIPNFLRSSDVGLMLYDRKKTEIYKGQNPLKLYEYAAAGLPVVSTFHSEYDYIKPPVVTVQDEKEVEKGLETIFNSYDTFKQNMLEFAKKYSWIERKNIAEKKFREFELI